MNTQPNSRKVAIVTGSATGVGAATALALSRRGYDLLINYSKSEREAREAEAACRDAGADTLLVRGDVADDADCRNMADAALARWNRLDALVNNAGISTFTRCRELGRAGCRRVRAHFRRQRPRRVPDGPRLPAALEGGARRHRQRVFHRRSPGHRLVGAVHRIEGRRQLDDASSGALPCSGDPRQRGLPRSHHHALVRRWSRAGSLRKPSSKGTSKRRRLRAPAPRKTSPKRWCGLSTAPER